MISIIVCSVDSGKLESLTHNIEHTIGVEYEIIAFDNSNHRYGITKVYNLCARQSKYDYLCFVHEDILFFTPGWGKIILNKLKEPTCGVIGFAGSYLKSKSISGWAQRERYNRTNYIQRFPKRKNERIFMNNIPSNIDYFEVVALDGMCLFASKKLWNESPFDESILQGFHGYDLDFCLRAVDKKYHNYICNCIILEHFSVGSYNKEWVRSMKSLHHERWNDKLPISIEEVSQEEMEKNEEFAQYLYAKYTIKSNSPISEAFRAFYNYSRRGTPSFISTLLFKFLIYRIIPLKAIFNASK